MREFATGATRDTDQDKYDYEGFLSPAVLTRFAEYMHHHRKQADGNLRDSDNWQKGIPKDAYMKSAFRHFIDLWTLHRGGKSEGVTLEDTLCALLFNIQGYLHEELKGAESGEPDLDLVRHWQDKLQAQDLIEKSREIEEDSAELEPCRCCGRIGIHAGWCGDRNEDL